MSAATNMGVVSFAQNLIYDVTRCKVQTPERVGLAVLLKQHYWFSRTRKGSLNTL